MDTLTEYLQLDRNHDCKRQLIASIASKCETILDAQVLVALCTAETEGDRLLDPLLDSLVDGNAKNCEILPILLENLPSVGPYVYGRLTEKLAESAQDEESLEHYLELIQFLVLARGKQTLVPQLLEALWKQVNAEEDKTADFAARILNSSKFEAFNSDMWWDIIQSRINSPVKSDIPAYKAWLAWAQHGPTQALVKYSQNETYWNLLKQGITGSPRSTERVKYCLNIMSLTLKALDTPLMLPGLVNWNPSEPKIQTLWTRYIAVLEIVSVDMSLNQAESSRDDIFILTQNPKIIGHSWMLALVKSGLTTQAENIRAFIIDTVFDFPRLDIFNAPGGLTLLVENFLPLALEPNRFDIVDEAESAYVGKIKQLVRRLLNDLSSENKVLFLDTLVQHYQRTVYSFDTSRLVVISALAECTLPRLPPMVAKEIAKYANSARRVSKSRAIGDMIFRKSLALFVRNGLDKGSIAVLSLFFPHTDTFCHLTEVLDAVSEDLRPEIQTLAAEKAIYFIVYYLKWGDPEIATHPQCDQIINYLRVPVLRDSLVNLASIQLDVNGYLEGETCSALSFFSAIELAPSTTNEMPYILGKLQITGIDKANPLPTHELLKVLSGEYFAGYQNNQQRHLSALCVKYALDQLEATEAVWPSMISLIPRCFSHDFKDTQTSVLACIRRFLAVCNPDCEEFGNALVSMWETLNENGLKALDRGLQIDFIKLIYSDHIYSCPRLGPYVLKIGLDIVKQSHSRKNLLVPLVTSIVSHDHLQEWACELLVSAYCLVRTHHDVFYLEDIVLNDIGVYKEYWGENEYMARALAIKSLSDQPKLAETIASHILSHYNLFDVFNRHDGDEENTRILCYQILTIIEHNWSSVFVEGLISNLNKAIDTEGSKIARIYVEWLVSKAVLRDISRFESVIVEPLRNSTEPRFVSSLGRIGLLVGKALGSSIPTDYWTRFTNVIVPLATSNKAAVRHFSVAVVYAMSLDPNLYNKLGPAVQEFVAGIASCATSSDQFKNFKQGDDCVWDVNKDCTLKGVCGQVIAKLYQWEFKFSIPNKILAQVLGERVDPPQTDRAISNFASVTTIRDLILTENIQTKSGIDEGVKRGELIVVASLCDIPVNLGAICRLSDALGAKLLTLDDLKVTKSTHFRNTAVTADRWMPIDQVKVDEIAEFMLEMKSQGYTLVGLEQTDNSRKLEPSLQFPKKTLLLIGRERLGIPAHLLAHLDFCVEIEQWGVVRSMNVQTATAVIVHAYNHQHV